MIFEPVTKETLESVLEVVNSNPTYNTMENDVPIRSLKEVSEEFLNETTESYLIKIEDKAVGVIDFLKNNPKDECPWIGLLMIHGDYHSLGFGKKAYVAFEEELKRREFTKVRLGVIQENQKAIIFWQTQGFESCGFRNWGSKVVECFQKQI
jgi:GNAT superfamily N-acetyltransferase